MSLSIITETKVHIMYNLVKQLWVDVRFLSTKMPAVVCARMHELNGFHLTSLISLKANIKC